MLKKGASACCNNVRSVAIAKNLELARKIKAMKTMSRALSDLMASCDDDTKPVDECPILAGLETDSNRWRGAS